MATSPRLQDQPIKAVLTKSAVYTITSQSRLLRAWGRGFFGLNSTTPEGTFLPVPTQLYWRDSRGIMRLISDAGVADIAAPDDGSFVVMLMGKTDSASQYNAQIYTWGMNDLGQLGRNLSMTMDDNPQLISNWVNEGASSIHAGNDFVIVRQPTGRLWGWGNNQFGQLGINATQFPGVVAPRQLDATVDYAAVSTGAYHVVACAVNGRLYTYAKPLSPLTVILCLPVHSLNHLFASFSWGLNTNSQVRKMPQLSLLPVRPTDAAVFMLSFIAWPNTYTYISLLAPYFHYC